MVQDGRGRLDPLAATLAGAGRIALRAAADVTQDPPAVQVAARTEGPGIDLATALGHLGLPRRAAGRLELDAALRGRGRDLRAAAAGATGHLGLAMPGGRLDGSLLEAVPAELRRILLPSGAGGDIPVRCLALRLDAQDGLARLRTLLLETGLGRLGGEGGVNLRDETLALRLLPDLRVGPVQVRAPVSVAGTLADPRFGVSPEAAVAGGLGAFLSLQRTPDRALQGLAEALGGGGGGAAAALPDCGAALAAAPTPPAAASPAPAAPAPAVPGLPRELQGPAQDLLRGLFGRTR